MKTITTEELNAIKFYLGDSKTVEDKIYLGGEKAYVTINALLNLGTRNEKDKAKEGKIVELYNVGHLKSYLSLINLIFSASVKYKDNYTEDNTGSLTSYRVDRYSSLKHFLNSGSIEGFFSTCKSGLLPEYANSKIDIALLQVDRDSSVPFIDFEKLLKDHYAKPEEAEILIPFGTRITSIEKVEMTEEEKNIYHDQEGKPPVGKWIVKLSQGSYETLSPTEEEQCYKYITDTNILNSIIESMRGLSSGQQLNAENERVYFEWKEKLNKYVNNNVAKILKRKEY